MDSRNDCCITQSRNYDHYLRRQAFGDKPSLLGGRNIIESSPLNNISNLHMIAAQNLCDSLVHLGLDLGLTFLNHSFCAKRPCSLCAQIRSSCLFGLVACRSNRFLPRGYGGFTHAFAYWDFEKWFLEVSKSYPSLIALATGIWHKRDPLFDHFLSNFFEFLQQKY